MRTTQRLPWYFLLIMALPGLVIGILLLASKGHGTAQLSWLHAIPAISILLYVIFYLRVEINASGIEFQWTPFVHRRYKWDELALAQERTIDPLSDFGGWGLKYSRRFQAWSFTIWGNQALCLTLKSGRVIFVGLKDEKAAQQALAVHAPRITR